ncbi:hypothetical protein JW851_00365 [Candidatus Woesearchaeota archaeon]|nr:hypothetical protein [Candidatus Woesearchaeota archaeon]
MKKSQIAVSTLVGLAMLAIVIVVIFLIVFPVIKDLFEKEGEKIACEWSLVFHSIAKLGDWSLIPAECRAHRIEVNLEDLEKYKKEAEKRIKTYTDDPDKYGPILKYFNKKDDPAQLREWALNKIIAVEMKDCWSKVFQGKLPLFDKWWNLYDFPWEKSEPDESQGHLALRSFIGKFYQAPVNCIVCSRIKFDELLTKDFIKNGRNNVDSLNAWLMYNYPVTGSKSYYELIAEGQSPVKDVFVPRYGAYSVDTPLGILYEKVYAKNELFRWRWLKDVVGFGKDELNSDEKFYTLNYVKVVPYTQEMIINPDKGEGCTFVLD